MVRKASDRNQVEISINVTSRVRVSHNLWITLLIQDDF